MNDTTVYIRTMAYPAPGAETKKAGPHWAGLSGRYDDGKGCSPGSGIRAAASASFRRRSSASRASLRYGGMAMSPFSHLETVRTWMPSASASCCCGQLLRARHRRSDSGSPTRFRLMRAMAVLLSLTLLRSVGGTLRTGGPFLRAPLLVPIVVDPADDGLEVLAAPEADLGGGLRRARCIDGADVTIALAVAIDVEGGAHRGDVHPDDARRREGEDAHGVVCLVLGALASPDLERLFLGLHLREDGFIKLWHGTAPVLRWPPESGAQSRLLAHGSACSSAWAKVSMPETNR